MTESRSPISQVLSRLAALVMGVTALLLWLSWDFGIAPQIRITENALFAWEGDRVLGYLGASTNRGAIEKFEIDINRDGQYDATFPYHAKIRGGLLRKGPPLSLIGKVDDGDLPVRVRITLETGETATINTKAHVGNVFPVDTLPDLFHPEGRTIHLPLSYYDPAPDTVHMVKIDWGDGTSSTYTAPFPAFTHMYPADGVYDTLITATDEDCTTTRKYRILVGKVDAPVNAEPSEDGTAE